MVKQNHKWDPSSSHLPGRGGGEENAELLLLTRESTNYWKIPLVVIKLRMDMAQMHGIFKVQR